MEGEGMVAVVRGLRDAGLAVTLLDSGRQYTLLPDATSQPVSTNLSHTTASQCSAQTPRENAVQATDGRYASTYKMMHCNVTPTSPSDQVSEFPPQRAEIYPGYDNFEVGGPGSGENYCPPIRSSVFRGAMSWSDRGAIFRPRPSLQPDSFANSLRKYPSLSQDRSSEIVERLINFTQIKNLSRNKSTPSPTRNIDSDVSTHTVALEGSQQTSRTQRYEPEVHIRPKRSEESPTKDRPKKFLVEREPVEPWRRSTFSKTNDVRYLKDVSRKVREGIRTFSPNYQPERLLRERYDSPSGDKKTSTNQCSTNSVNMEIQAAVQMVSREIVTVPIIVPSQRTVAVPLTSTSSLVARRSEGSLACSHPADIDTIKHLTEFVQTKLDPVDINIQTVLSAIEISNHKCNHKKRSKSQDMRFSESMKTELLHLIERLPLDPNYCASFKVHRKSHNRSSKNNNIHLKRAEDTKFYENTREIKLDRGFSKMNSKYMKKSLARIFHAEVTPYRMKNEDDLAELLQDWIDLIPLKRTDAYSTNVNKQSLFYELFEYIRKGVYSLKGLDKGYHLKTEIINKLESIPLEIRGNRWVLENRLADILVDKLNKIRRKPSDHFLLVEDSELRSRKSKFKFRYPPERELRNFVMKELSIFLRKFDSKLNQRQIKEVENELIELLSISVGIVLRGSRDKYLIMNITELLVDYGVPEHKAIYFSNALIRRFRDVYIICNGEGKIGSETFIVFSNTETVQANCNATCTSLSIKSINDDDIQANVDSYTKDLCSQIDEWLTQLPISIPQERVFREVVVNDLAGDIIDRHRYIELNPNSSKSDATELEHLKYQIFKWINKFVADDNLETSKYAPDLMRRIKDIPVPMLSRLRDLNSVNQNRQNANANTSDASKTIHFKTIPPYDKSLDLKTSPKDNQPPSYPEQENIHQLSIQENDDKAVCNQTQNSEQCCSGVTDKIEKTIDQLEEEYAKFVKDWVKLIPIEATTPEEQVVADKARLGIHNGIWKVVSKLNCDPATYYNRFFYEDLLDDGIEDLLDCLPQTPELQSKKHVLKSKLIGKTADINDHIRANEDASFKHNLIKNIFSSLRKQGITRGDGPVKVYEDMQVRKIVEDFLLCTSFKNDNKVKAEIYKKKLFKHIEDFIDDLKQHHPKETKDVDISLYKTDIINILLKVRLPSEDIIKQEADSILLDLEIEQWYIDLPIIPSNDYKEQYQRSKQREFLAKKVKEFENDNNDFSESALRLEVSKFLENVLIKEAENLNINFMMDQFVNRIKNRPKQETTQIAKKVAFQTIPNYEDFSKDISFCSSFIHAPKIPVQTHEPAHDDDKNKSKQLLKCGGQLVDNSTNLLENNVPPQSPTNKSRVIIQEPPTYRTFNEGRPISSSFYSETNNQELHTLEEFQGASNLNMYSIPPYYSPEQRIPQRHEQQHQEEDSIHNTVVENKTCCPKTLELDDVSGTEQKHATNGGLYPQKAKENKEFEKIKFKGFLGTSQVAGPSGYSSKISANVNDICYKPEICEPLPGLPPGTPPCHSPGPSRDPSPGPCSGSPPCKLPEDSTTHKTRLTDEQMPQTNNKCSSACQTCNILQPDSLREENCIKKEDKQNACTNTLSNLPRYSENPHDVSGPNIRGDKLTIHDKNANRRNLSSYECEEDDDEPPCRCIEKYFRRRHPYEMFDNYPPCVPLLFPYPCFF